MLQIWCHPTPQAPASACEASGRNSWEILTRCHRSKTSKTNTKQTVQTWYETAAQWHPCHVVIMQVPDKQDSFTDFQATEVLNWLGECAKPTDPRRNLKHFWTLCRSEMYSHFRTLTNFQLSTQNAAVCVAFSNHPDQADRDYISHTIWKKQHVATEA